MTRSLQALLVAALVLLALASCTSASSPPTSPQVAPGLPLPESILPHNLRLSPFLSYDDGTEDGTKGVAPCLPLSSMKGPPIHQIGVIASTTGGNSIYTQGGHPNLFGRIGPSGNGLPVFAEGNVRWNSLHKMGVRADLLEVAVKTPNGCMIFYEVSGAA